ncbi:hypothetical protein AAV94_05030 [Lampropedia cohaerens]|uniref:HAD family hydrolase n=1 Tax=Lampropedia cohaerens TaxID=1610491 RepID=A0A0U1Q126_9BURK|nr:HAD family hydrolase [Lampropedia cohaerens]KKW68463.1 hypothetical protein AAV94_05030 [Lampropedia cohaerens]
MSCSNSPFPEPSHIRAITLDLDDTLWPVWPTIHKAEAHLLAWLQVHAPRAAAHWQQPGVPQALRAAVEAAHPDRLHDLSFLRKQTIAQVLQAAGEDVALAEPAFAEFFAVRQQVEPYPEVEEALRRLAARWPLIALSNGNAQVMQMPVGRYFHSALGAREAGVAKPDARIFAQAARQAGCALQEIMHVGDDPLLDVDGARQAGMHVAWINREGAHWPLVTAVPRQFRELTALADALLGRQD